MRKRQELDNGDGDSDQEDEDYSENVSVSVSEMSEDPPNAVKSVTRSELENLEKRLVEQIAQLLDNRGMGTTYDASSYSAGGEYSSSNAKYE